MYNKILQKELHTSSTKRDGSLSDLIILDDDNSRGMLYTKHKQREHRSTRIHLLLYGSRKTNLLLIAIIVFLISIIQIGLAWYNHKRVLIIKLIIVTSECLLVIVGCITGFGFALIYFRRKDSKLKLLNRIILILLIINLLIGTIFTLFLFDMFNRDSQVLKNYPLTKSLTDKKRQQPIGKYCPDLPKTIHGRIYGGLGGGPFDDSINIRNLDNFSTYYPSQLSFSWCDWLESMNMTYILISNTTKTVHTWKANRYGGDPNCVSKTFSLDRDERIQKVSLTFGEHWSTAVPRHHYIILGIQFHTNKNRMSPYYGSQFRGVTVEETYDGYVLNYISGTAGKFIDQLQLHWVLEDKQVQTCPILPKTIHLNDRHFANTDCYSASFGGDYEGTRNYTVTNSPCKPWTQTVSPNNYCRNPENAAPYGPWCYVTNTEWEYCGIPLCRIEDRLRAAYSNNNDYGD